VEVEVGDIFQVSGIVKAGDGGRLYTIEFLGRIGIAVIVWSGQ
jgi:hypothetical protein